MPRDSEEELDEATHGLYGIIRELYPEPYDACCALISILCWIHKECAMPGHEDFRHLKEHVCSGIDSYVEMTGAKRATN